MTDTPETDAQLTTFTSISKLKRHFVNRTGTVSAEFARRLERERDEARQLLKTATRALNCIHVEVGGWIKDLMDGGKR
jgi:hypothetical protein